MTELKLKQFIVSEVERVVALMLNSALSELGAALQGLKTQASEDAALMQEIRRRNEAILLKLAEIERQLGIDPAASEADPNYRN